MICASLTLSDAAAVGKPKGNDDEVVRETGTAGSGNLSVTDDYELETLYEIGVDEPGNVTVVQIVTCCGTAYGGGDDDFPMSPSRRRCPAHALS